MVPSLLLLLMLLPQPADTVELSADQVLTRVLETSPRVESARQRTLSGRARAGQARAWTNPALSVSVENVGAAEPVTGLPSPEGLEGQAVLGFRLPIGGDRGAAIRQADAQAMAWEAEAARTSGEVLLDVVAAAAASERDRTVAELAGEEARTLGRLAEALTAQAEEGRASEGEAARVRLEASLAEGTAAEARAAASAASTELARLLGYAPEQEVVVRGGACRQPLGVPPALAADVAVVRAREAAARAGVQRARAGRIPDLEPQVGFRRAAGTEALFLGLGFQLPLFDRSGRAVEAAAAELAAARADRRAVEDEVAARRLAAFRSLEVLEAAGSRFRAGWADDLARVVEATEARYDLGEGTLVELLDGRRARFEAMTARERWRAAWRLEHARLLRFSGAEPAPAFFCDPLAREG